MTGTWDREARGVVVLPSGRLVRGRALRRPLPDGPVPQFAVHLLGRDSEAVAWPCTWLRWPDFRLPADDARARKVLAEAWERAAHERVEIACAGGKGRTGTALALLAVLDGVPRQEAVAWVRDHYDSRAVETPGSGAGWNGSRASAGPGPAGGRARAGAAATRCGSSRSSRTRVIQTPRRRRTAR